SYVSLRVYDILGREVATLVNGIQDAGVHVATFDGTRLASGVYFYRLTASGKNQVKKMLLAK
ncbi:MAG: T9SS type A sorting domain-containing protein, partial [Candidatus Kryptoniota bacterium]